MPSIEFSLSNVVQALVPQTRDDERLCAELVDHSLEILHSHLGQEREPDMGHLVVLVKRQIMLSSIDSAASLRFSNLLVRLLEQPALTRKHAVLLFLYSLASSTSHEAQTQGPLVSLVPPLPVRSSTPSIAPHSPKILEMEAKAKTKADILREYREQIGRPHLPEQALLRDTLYILQGISGQYVRFAEGKRGEEYENNIIFVEDPQYTISPQSKALIHRIAELGHLCLRVSCFVQAREGQPTVGTIEQSLCHHLQTQLTEYYSLVAVLESQMSFTAAIPRSENVTINPHPREQETGLTLRRLEVWIDEWRLRMRMMSVCVEGAKDVHGGSLVSLIHGYANNGDPFIRKFTDQLLEQVSQPFFSMLQKWLFAGELQDPYSEFFVTVNPELAHLEYLRPPSSGNASLLGDGGFGGAAHPENDALESGMRLWDGKYQFRKEMLPRFVGETFGRKILSTGKSLNFIRYNCHDSDWVATRNKLSSAGRTLRYSDIGGLERSIDTAYQIASQRLFEIFFEKFKLLDHLCALKDYLMLEHGDFADQLMETLGPSLSRPANTLYRHNLTATLESAISSSNAQNDSPDVLRRLDARMLEYSHGEIGWDVFTLEYRIDSPIDTVIGSDSMINYMKLFAHIWKMRRVENSLVKGWMRIAGGVRTFRILPELQPHWHRTRIVMAEMIHVIRQMQMYTQIEVIAVRWKKLLTFVHKKEGDLDALIAAHRGYLADLVNKTLMISKKPGKEENLLERVRELFRVILQFGETIDEFYNYSLAEAARRDQLRDEGRGVFTGAPSQHSPVHAVTLERILERINEYSTSFSEGAQGIVQALQGHTDSDCKDLAARLNFTRYYSPGRDREQHLKGSM